MNPIFETLTQPICEMSNIRKSKYKTLPSNIWISPETQNNHIPRVKVQQDTADKVNYNNFCSVSISDNPEILVGSWKLSAKDKQDIFAFIVKNKDVLLNIWNKEQDLQVSVSQIKE